MRCLLAVVCGSMLALPLSALPAQAEIYVNDVVAKIYGKRTRVEVQLTNPGYLDQNGPVVVELQTRSAPDGKWDELYRWTLPRIKPGPLRVLVYHSPKLIELAKAKTFECQIRVEGPALEPLEKSGRLEKPDE